MTKVVKIPKLSSGLTEVKGKGKVYWTVNQKMIQKDVSQKMIQKGVKLRKQVLLTTIQVNLARQRNLI
jgi:uncharacterized sodium:solute symporter family permease YidK